MRGGDKHRRATIHDVARAAGVSAATVSKVLRGVVIEAPIATLDEVRQGQSVVVAVVQGIAISVVVALVVVFLAGGSAGEAPDSSDATVSGVPPRAASVIREQG